jgi:glycosyltransferase involved in cell wall biosynthesis
MKKLKLKLRLILGRILYLYYQFAYKKFEITRDGKPLKKGISAVVSAKNEEYTIPFCLKSLIGVADQVVCIDNGSEDNTLLQMKKFKDEYGDKIEVDIIEMPQALLGDCREAGLSATRYQWHLRWDADMVCKTSGIESMILLREKILNDDSPRAIQLPRTNLYGDWHHTSILSEVVDPGEPILIKMSTKIEYKEFGKFDSIRLPVYYKIEKASKRYYFHCAGQKSDENLIHRYFYFIWREAYNKAKSPEEKEKLKSYEDFRNSEAIRQFGTTDKNSLKYRYQRQCVQHFVKYEPEKYGDYPDVLLEEIRNRKERFKIIYKDGRPFIRLDYTDVEMQNYEPAFEDLNWDPKKFLEKLISPKEIELIFQNNPAFTA